MRAGHRSSLRVRARLCLCAFAARASFAACPGSSLVLLECPWWLFASVVRAGARETWCFPRADRVDTSSIAFPIATDINRSRVLAGARERWCLLAFQGHRVRDVCNNI